MVAHTDSEFIQSFDPSLSCRSFSSATTTTGARDNGGKLYEFMICEVTTGCILLYA